MPQTESGAPRGSARKISVNKKYHKIGGGIGSERGTTKAKLGFPLKKRFLWLGVPLFYGQHSRKVWGERGATKLRLVSTHDKWSNIPKAYGR